MRCAEGPTVRTQNGTQEHPTGKAKKNGSKVGNHPEREAAKVAAGSSSLSPTSESSGVAFFSGHALLYSTCCGGSAFGVGSVGQIGSWRLIFLES